MKRFTSVVAASVVLAALVTTTHAQTTLYWDVTNNTPGFVTPGSFGDGTWDSVTTANWNPNSNGSGANTTWDDTASPPNNAIIDVAGAAGTNATGWVSEDAGITVAAGTRTTGTTTIGGSSGAFQWVVLQGTGSISAPNGFTVQSNTRVSAFPTPNFLTPFAGVIDTGTGNLNVNSGALLEINGLGRLNSTGRVVLNGGTLYEKNTGSAGSFISATKNLEVNGTGTIGYDDTNTTPDNQVSILNGTIIFGTGGDPSTGGAGTLIKTGPDQIGYAYKADTGNGQSNAAQNSFAKLKVVQGTFRLRGAGTPIVVDERLFGAVPTAPLADAITLDGAAYTVGSVNCPGACAGIGTNTTVSLHANRGITFGPNGGYFDNGAGGGLTVPGAISGSGPMAIGSPTTTSAANVTFTLSNANNINTFSGDLIGYRATLKLSSSLKVNGLKDGSSTQQPTNNSTVTIDTGNTLTVGVSNGGGTWSTAIAGAGGFTKMGSGTETLTATNTYTGATAVQGGTLSISNPYLADANDVLMTTGALFNLNFAGQDTIRSLLFDSTAQATGTWGAPGSGATHTSSLFSGTGLLNVTSSGTLPGVAGDYNGNGVVDMADYVLWRNGGPLLNEGVTVGTVSPEDYDYWRAHFGNTSGSGSGLSAGAAVPEPTSLALLLLSVTGLVAGRRVR